MAVALGWREDNLRAPSVLYDVRPKLTIGQKGSFVIWGKNLWREPLVIVGTQIADEVKILPDMDGLLVTLKPEQPAGWTATQDRGWAEIRLWTSTGDAFVGDAELFKPQRTPQQGNSTPTPFTVILSNNIVVADPSGRGAVELRVESKKKNEPLAPVHLAIEGARFDSAATKGECIDEDTFVVDATCRIELGLGNLVNNTTITLKAWQQMGDKKVEHPPISIHVRGAN